VGSHCLNFLLQNNVYDRVYSVARRPLNIQHEKLTEYTIDFMSFNEHKEKFKVETVFCCLGTTIKTAGSQENFKEVDYAYPLKAGQMSLEMGVKSFSMVTALGANRKSKIFYNRVKGEIETELIALGLNSLSIFRPSMLTGKRRENRLGEKIGTVAMVLLNHVLVGRFKKYRSITAAAVAEVMAAETESKMPGLHIYESNEIAAIYENLHRAQKQA